MAKGQTLVNSGQYQEAVKVCRLGLLGRPTTVEGRVVLGQALLALKRYDEVLAEMRVALELDHHSFTAQRLKAEALLHKGDPHAALEVLRKLQQQVPGSVDELLAECEIKLGRPAISASHPAVSYVGKGSGHEPDAGRHLDDFEIIVPAFLVVGDTDTDRARWRELARMQVAFYGSTPNYAFIFEQLDHPGTTAALRERQKAGDIAGMATIITDDILRHFTIEGTWATIADGIADRYAGLATRVVNYFGAIAWTEDPQSLARWKPIATALADAP